MHTSNDKQAFDMPQNNVDVDEYWQHIKGKPKEKWVDIQHIWFCLLLVILLRNVAHEQGSGIRNLLGNGDNPFNFNLIHLVAL